MAGADALTVAMEDCPAPAVLAPLWQALQAQSDASFFVSWTWIGSWLAGLEPRHRPRLLCARRGDQIVGLGVLVEHMGSRARVMPSRCWYLHETGESEFDTITIEHNGFLVHRDHAVQAEQAMLEYLCKRGPAWDQIHLPGFTHVPSLQTLCDSGVHLRERRDTLASVDLVAVRAAGGDHLARIGSNSRGQVRRSLKAYAELGPVTVTRAASLEQARDFLARLKVLHQRTWTARGLPGAFANPRMEAFHARLIDTGFERGEIQLLRVHAGEHDIGYLYNFVYRGRAMSYQSGFNYQLVEKRNHPGLAVHALAIQHCLEAGLEVYDFLAGDARYKRQLASDVVPMVWLSLHRASPSLWLEERWWAVKRRWRAMRGKMASPVEAADAPDAGND